MHLLITLIAGIFFLGCMAPSATFEKYSISEKSIKFEESTGPEEYWPSTSCRNCHDKIFEQHSQSMHAKSFTNPVFQAQYFNELIPLIFQDLDLIQEANRCIACHAPIAFMNNMGLITSKEQADPLMSGVTCDFCHTISGFRGKIPGSGNYIAAPSNQKLGPFKRKSTWHHIYSELQTKSEFCGICHNAVNRYGLEVKSTFTEWKYSRYAEEGIQCQDCHMNVQGFLVAGRPEYESGKAAHMTVGHSPLREKLYTHRFPGAHSKTQVIGALTLDIKTEKAIVSPSNVISVYVSVDNSRTGHKMPSGSADLRMLWIDLEAFIGNRVMSISASSDAKTNKYDISGGGQFDKEILRDDIPHGKRIYRAIYIDKSGRQTLSSYNASRIVFDNRLNATEIREEVYNFAVPKDARGTLILVAKLNYLRYPSSFADRFGMLRPESIEIATSKKELIID